MNRYAEELQFCGTSLRQSSITRQFNIDGCLARNIRRSILATNTIRGGAIKSIQGESGQVTLRSPTHSSRGKPAHEGTADPASTGCIVRELTCGDGSGGPKMVQLGFSHAPANSAFCHVPFSPKRATISISLCSPREAGRILPDVSISGCEEGLEDRKLADFGERTKNKFGIISPKSASLV